jgi:alkaline phosphatase
VETFTVSRWVSIVVALAACGGTPGGSDPGRDATTANKRVVILMIGDGMGTGQREAASVYAHGAPGRLFLESLPVRGTVITSGPSGTTDSAAAATTMATGRRAFNGAIGIDRDDVPVQTVVELAHELGLPAGVVATSSLPHATPGAFTAHRDSRHDLTQIAEDQVRVAKPDVMLGGGAQYFLPAGPGSLRNDGGLMGELAGYHVVRTADELAAVPKDGKLAGMFATDHLEYTIARPANTPEPTLVEMSRIALDRLDASPDGFFLMIEGSRIDMASHTNLLAEMIGETNVFDNTVRAVSDWAAGRDDVTLIVTSDHECGGLEVTKSNGAGVLPDVRWRWLQHTNAPVGVYAWGPGTEVFDNAVVDHRYIYGAIAARLRGTPFATPTAERIADGRLADLPTLAAMQTNTSGFGVGYNQLDALRVAADDDVLAIGIDGVFERGHNALVVLIDVDFGASTGPARMRGALTDLNGTADGILSSLNLDAPMTAGFGVDLALVAHGAEDPWREQTVTEAGLRGLRAPYGQANNLGWYGVATNFGDGTKSLASPTPAVTPIAGRGYEAQIAWKQLYPNGRPAMPRLAIAAVLVNDDGGYTSNQALPAFPPNTPNPARAPTALPGIVVLTVDGSNVTSSVMP